MKFKVILTAIYESDSDEHSSVQDGTQTEVEAEKEFLIDQLITLWPGEVKIQKVIFKSIK